MKKEGKQLIIQTTKDVLWWPAVVFAFFLYKVIFDRTNWEAVFVALMATPFIFLDKYRINTYKVSAKRQMVEWLILTALLITYGSLIYLMIR